MRVVAALAVASGGILPGGGALGAQDDSVMFAGFEGTWTVTAIVSGEADATEERRLRATVERSDMDPVRSYQVVLTGSLPGALVKTCPETSGVPLPCETSFYLVCYCDGEEEWFQERFVRMARSERDVDWTSPFSGTPDATGRRLGMRRKTGGRSSVYAIWTRQPDGFLLRHLRISATGERLAFVELTFRRLSCCEGETE